MSAKIMIFREITCFVYRLRIIFVSCELNNNRL
jgi:hypothetical protein